MYLGIGSEGSEKGAHGARRPLQSEGVAELHANAFQKVLDMPSLPNGFRKQVADSKYP